MKTRQARRGEQAWNASISEDDVRWIRDCWARGETLAQIRENYPQISRVQIWRIATRKRWRHVA